MGKELIYIHFPRILNSTGKQHGHHPAVALMSKRAYWMVGGCDEDFVGHYGNTDPHFKWRAAHTDGVTVVDVSKEIPDVHQLLQERGQGGWTELSRSTKNNKELLKAKTAGRVPWSSDYLRFAWRYLPALARL